MPILSSDLTNSKGTSFLWNYQSKQMNPSLFVHDILTMNRDEVNTQMLKKKNCVSNVGIVQHFFLVGSVDNININNQGRRNPSL